MSATSPPDPQQDYYDGVPGALQDLWTTHSAALWESAFVASMHNEHLAADAIAVTYEKLEDERTRTMYDPKRDWLPWVMKILRREVINVFRTQTTKSKGGGVLEPEPPSGMNGIPGPDVPPERREILREEQIIYERCLNLLSHEQKRILILRYCENRKFEDISTLLRGSVATIFRKSNKAFQSLQELRYRLEYSGGDLDALDILWNQYRTTIEERVSKRLATLAQSQVPIPSITVEQVMEQAIPRLSDRGVYSVYNPSHVWPDFVVEVLLD